MTIMTAIYRQTVGNQLENGIKHVSSWNLTAICHPIGHGRTSSRETPQNIPSRRKACSGAAARHGTTLTEVLISVLIMSIGVVSVATIFPLSVLRSIHASQLTNAAFVAMNAEGVMGAFPGVVAEVPANTNAIVDPLGWNLMPAALQANFGNTGAANPNTNIVRYYANRVTVPAADHLVTLPDNWLEMAIYKTTTSTSGNGITTLTLPSTVDLGSVPVGPSGPSTAGVSTRAVFLDDTGKRSQTRDITSITGGNTLNWSTALPSTFGNIGEVRIQTQERRYTWILTVRKDVIGQSDIDVVVFFRRPFAVVDEQIYSSSDSGGNPISPTGLSFTWGSTNAYLSYLTGVPPLYKKGSFVLDSDNLQWYQIQSVGTEAASSVSGYSYVPLTLSRPAVANGAGAIVMRGVVEVYPLGTK